MLRLVGVGVGVEEFQWSEDEQVWPFEKAKDGSTLYCTEVDFGALPNNGTKFISIVDHIPSLNGKNAWSHVFNYTFSYGASDFDTFRKYHSLSVLGTFLEAGDIGVVTNFDYSAITGIFRVIYKK